MSVKPLLQGAGTISPLFPYDAHLLECEGHQQTLQAKRNQKLFA